MISWEWMHTLWESQEKRREKVKQNLEELTVKKRKIPNLRQWHRYKKLKNLQLKKTQNHTDTLNSNCLKNPESKIRSYLSYTRDIPSGYQWIFQQKLRNSEVTKIIWSKYWKTKGKFQERTLYLRKPSFKK